VGCRVRVGDRGDPGMSLAQWAGKGGGHGGVAAHPSGWQRKMSFTIEVIDVYRCRSVRTAAGRRF
jgi:hypothetical protein